jgi:outer membrane biosynthesis protein TonB
VQASPSDLGFEDEVLKVVPKWKFTPAVQQGRAVGVWVAIPFKFVCKH